MDLSVRLGALSTAMLLITGALHPWDLLPFGLPCPAVALAGMVFPLPLLIPILQWLGWCSLHLHAALRI